MTDPQTTAERLAHELDTLPPELPRYVVEEYLIDAVKSLRDLIERING